MCFTLSYPRCAFWRRQPINLSLMRLWVWGWRFSAKGLKVCWLSHICIQCQECCSVVKSGAFLFPLNGLPLFTSRRSWLTVTDCATEANSLSHCLSVWYLLPAPGTGSTVPLFWLVYLLKNSLSRSCCELCTLACPHYALWIESLRVIAAANYIIFS